MTGPQVGRKRIERVVTSDTLASDEMCGFVNIVPVSGWLRRAVRESTVSDDAAINLSIPIEGLNL